MSESRRVSAPDLLPDVLVVRFLEGLRELMDLRKKLVWLEIFFPEPGDLRQFSSRLTAPLTSLRLPCTSSAPVATSSR